MRTFGIFVLAIITVAALVFGVAAFRGTFAEFFGRMQAEVDIESSNSRIANYTMFFNRCAAIQGYEDQILVLEGQLEATPEDQVSERQRISQSLSGIRGQRARAIRRYNSEASQDYTSARFLASNLPYQISIDGSTTCAVQ